MVGIYSCKGCVPPERHVGCHSTCEKYLSEKDKYDKLKEEELKNSMGGYRTNTDGTFRVSKRYRKRSR